MRVVRRVLVLIQVGLAALARDKHTPETKLDRRNAEKSNADGCEVAAEPLGEPSHFPVGADVDFVDWGLPPVVPTFCRQLAFFICLITSGLTSPIYTPSSKHEKLSKSKSF